MVVNITLPLSPYPPSLIGLNQQQSTDIIHRITQKYLIMKYTLQGLKLSFIIMRNIHFEISHHVNICDTLYGISKYTFISCVSQSLRLFTPL